MKNSLFLGLSCLSVLGVVESSVMNVSAARKSNLRAKMERLREAKIEKELSVKNIKTASRISDIKNGNVDLKEKYKRNYGISRAYTDLKKENIEELDSEIRRTKQGGNPSSQSTGGGHTQFRGVEFDSIKDIEVAFLGVKKKLCEIDENSIKSLAFESNIAASNAVASVKREIAQRGNLDQQSLKRVDKILELLKDVEINVIEPMLSFEAMKTSYKITIGKKEYTMKELDQKIDNGELRTLEFENNGERELALATLNQWIAQDSTFIPACITKIKTIKVNVEDSIPVSKEEMENKCVFDILEDVRSLDDKGPLFSAQQKSYKSRAFLDAGIFITKNMLVDKVREDDLEGMLLACAIATKKIAELYECCDDGSGIFKDVDWNTAAGGAGRFYYSRDGEGVSRLFGLDVAFDGDTQINITKGQLYPEAARSLYAGRESVVSNEKICEYMLKTCKEFLSNSVFRLKEQFANKVKKNSSLIEMLKSLGIALSSR